MAAYEPDPDDREVVTWMNQRDFMAISIEVGSILHGRARWVSDFQCSTFTKGVVKSNQHVKTK